jgi:hypothetical protein
MAGRISVRPPAAVKRLRDIRPTPYAESASYSKALAMTDRRKEIKENFEFFQHELSKLLPAYRDKFALLRHKKIVGYYETVSDAVGAANSLYSDHIYSVQQVTDAAADAGFYSHAMPLGTS